MVMPKRIRRKMAITKNKPMRPMAPTLRYQTPFLKAKGHKGNMTRVNTIAKAPAAYSFCLI